MRRLRQWLWYERGEGFAERGLWRPFPVAFVRVNGAFAASLIAILVGTFAVLLTPLAELFDLFSAPYSVLVVFVPQLLFGPRQYRLKQFMKRDVVAAPDPGDVAGDAERAGDSLGVTATAGWQRCGPTHRCGSQLGTQAVWTSLTDFSRARAPRTVGEARRHRRRRGAAA